MIIPRPKKLIKDLWAEPASQSEGLEFCVGGWIFHTQGYKFVPPFTALNHHAGWEPAEKGGMTPMDDPWAELAAILDTNAEGISDLIAANNESGPENRITEVERVLNKMGHEFGPAEELGKC